MSSSLELFSHYWSNGNIALVQVEFSKILICLLPGMNEYTQKIQVVIKRKKAIGGFGLCSKDIRLTVSC